MMRHWVVVLLLVCVVSLHLHGALGKRKPTIIIFFVDDVSVRLSNDSAQGVIRYPCSLVEMSLSFNTRQKKCQAYMMARKCLLYKCS